MVREGSFTGAADVLEVGPSAVSRRISRLEDKLATRLLQRTTRSVRPTAAGDALFLRTGRIAAELEGGHSALASMAAEPSGRLRISTPGDLPAPIEDLLPRFIRKYPKVQVELEITARYVALIAEGFDLALRGGEGPDKVGCTHCGSCMVGCRVGAKNTLDRNYLYLAEKNGATVHADTKLTDLEPLPGGGWNSREWHGPVRRARGWLPRSPERS